MANFSVIDQGMENIILAWNNYAAALGEEEAVQIYLGAGDFEGYEKACALTEAQVKHALVNVTMEKNGKQVELVRFPYFNVECVIDGRPSKVPGVPAYGMTGKPEQIAEVAQILAGIYR